MPVHDGWCLFRETLDVGVRWLVCAKQFYKENDRMKGIQNPTTPPSILDKSAISSIVNGAGKMPFSMKVWYEVVGGINFVGYHPEISPNGSQTDALFVASVDLY